MLQRGDAGGIVAAVFESLQRLDDPPRDRARAQDADDAAHDAGPRTAAESRALAQDGGPSQKTLDQSLLQRATGGPRGGVNAGRP